MSTQKRALLEVDDSSSGSLIPRLPNDVAMLCLLRVPVDTHASCKRVSRSWNTIFESNRHFSMLRKQSGFDDPWLVVFSYGSHGDKIYVHVLNLATLSWHEERITPGIYWGPGPLRSASIPSEGVVFVFGGVVCRYSTVNVFLKYEVREDRWTVIKSMAGTLGLITARAIDGKVYVTGLDKDLSDGEHGPVEVLDPEEGTWRPVPAFRKGTQEDDFVRAAVLDGRLLLTYKGDGLAGQIYDPRTAKWEVMADRLGDGLRGVSAAFEIHGHLFVLETLHRSLLWVYVAKSDSWEIVQGGHDLPQRIRWTSKACCWGSKIYVVTDYLGIVVGNVSKIMTSFRVQWETVADIGPEICEDILCPLDAQVLIARR